jgi:hypothetical protein
LWSVFLTPNCILFFQFAKIVGGMLELVTPYCEWWRQGVYGQSCQPVAGVASKVGLMCCQSQVWDISAYIPAHPETTWSWDFYLTTIK